MHRSISIALLVCLAVFAQGNDLFAGGPTTLSVSGHDALAKGRLDGLSLSDDGVLTPGPRFDAVPLEMPTAWAAVTSSDGATWIGTGNRAALLRVDAGGETTRVDVDGGFLITALAPLADGAVAAAVFPGARVLRVDAKGAVSELATLEAEHVWALRTTKRGELLAATGEPGTVQRIATDGTVSEVAKVQDAHCRALLVDAQGMVAGTAPRGLVLSLDGESPRVLRDLDEQEVVGLIRREDGSLLIGANRDSSGGNAQMLASLLTQVTKPSPTKPGQNAPARASLQDGRVYHLEQSGVLTELWSRPKVALLTLVADGTGAVAGTYPSGRIIRVQPGASSVLLADLPEAEASVLIGGAEGLKAVVTSNPAVLHRVQATDPRGTYTSDVLDAAAPALLGRVTVLAKGATKARVRSGSTKEPDDTWSAWTPLTGFDGRSGKAAGSARFVQLRVELAGPEAELRSLQLVVKTPNRAPALSALAVATPGADATQAPKANPKRQITWKATDPDGDRLATTVQVRRIGQAHWTTLVDAKVLAAPKTDWDTTGHPDGDYEVRVAITDSPDNPDALARGKAQQHSPVRVDNTAPVLSVSARVLEGGQLRVEGTTEDAAAGRIHSVRVAINGGAWRPLAAVDGLFDDTREAYAGTLDVMGAEAYDVVVQVLDAHGNLAAATTTVR